MGIYAAERSKMLVNIKPFIALYSAILLLTTGSGLLGTYIGLRLSMEGLSSQMTGLIMTAYFVGATAGAFFCRPMIRRVGHIRAFTVFAALLTGVTMCHGMYLSPLLWLLLRFLGGVATTGLYTVVESWLNECADVSVRGRVFSVYMVMTYMGTAVGQKLLGVGDVQTQTLFLVAGTFIVFSIIPISSTKGIHPRLPSRESRSLSTICRRAPLGLLGCFAAGIMQSGFYAMGPVFAHEIGLGVDQLSWFMAVVLVGGLLFQWPVGLISDRVDRSLMLPVLGLCIAGAAGLILKFHGGIFMLLGGSFFLGGFLFTLYPVAVARTHDLFDAEDVVKVSSVLLVVYGVGSILGPLSASTVITWMDTPYGFFYFFTGVALVYSVVSYVVRRKESVQIVSPEDQVDFVIMKETAQVAFHMDPRQDADEEDSAEVPPEAEAPGMEPAPSPEESVSPPVTPLEVAPVRQ